MVSKTGVVMTANRARLQVMQGCAGTVTAINAEHPIPGQLVHRASQLIDALLLQEHCQAILQRLTNTRCRSASRKQQIVGAELLRVCLQDCYAPLVMPSCSCRSVPPF